MAERISRRDFLQAAAAGTVAVAGAASIAPSEAQAAETEEKTAYDNMLMLDDSYWLGAAPEIADDQIAETIECEVLVLGGGNAGTAAACKAAESGAKVVVLESQSQDVFTYFATDNAFVNSKVFLDRGAERIDEVEFLNEWQRRTYGRSNPALIKKYVERSGEVCDWLIENIPDDQVERYMNVFNCPAPSHYEAPQCGYTTYQGMISWRDFEAGNKSAWPAAYQNILDKSVNLGADWHFATKAVRLVQDEDGNVRGAIGQQADGSYIKVLASKGTLLSCGDFGGNGDMVLALHDEVRNMAKFAGFDLTDTSYFANFGRDGSGIKMGIWAGGVMEPGPRASLMFTLQDVPQFPFGGNFPIFGKGGKRFHNESIVQHGGQGDVMRRPKGELMAVVTDSNWREDLEYCEMNHNAINLTDEDEMGVVMDDMSKLVTGPEGFEVTDMMRTDMGKTRIYAADTLEELAEILGFEGDAKQGFLDEVAHYNEMCRAGKDTDWGRAEQLLFPIETPPFLGCSLTTSNDRLTTGMVQVGGLVTDENQQVLRVDGSKIGGLYATGNCCGNRYAVQYHTIMPGNSCGIAISMGYVAGETIAAL